MATAVYPLPLDAKPAREVERGAEATGLTKAELMRQALAFGLPKLVDALRKPSGRITLIDPPPAREARTLCRCDLLFTVAKATSGRRRVTVTPARRREIARKLIQGLAIAGL